MTFRCWFKSFHMWHVSLECKIKRVAVHLMMFMINLTCRRSDCEPQCMRSCMCACLQEDLREASHMKRWHYSPLVQTTAFNEHMLAWTPLQGFLALPTQWHATWPHVSQQDMLDILIFTSSLLWKQMKQLHRERVCPKATGLTTVIFLPEVWAPKNQTAFVITTLNHRHLQRSFFVIRASNPLESKLLLAKGRHSRLNQFLLLSIGQIYGTATEAGHHTWGKRRTRRSGWMNSRTTTSAQRINTYVTSCTWTISKHINSRTTTSAQRINTYVTSCTWTISKHINSRTTASAQRINTYVTSCTWTISKHINSRTTASAQRINTYVTSCTWTISKHINSRTTTSAQRINTYVTSCTWTISKHINSRTTASAQRINTYVTSCTWTISKHINSRTTTSAQRINTYVTSCTWTISKHINSRTTTSAQRINTYVTSCTWTISKHINSRTTTSAQRINTYVTSMKINHHRGPGRTSPCHKNKMKHIFM